MRRVPDFDEIVGPDVPEAERERLRRTHELLARADPPPELSPELDRVPWPDESLGPLWPRKERARPRPMTLALGAAAALLIGFVLGQSRADDTTPSFASERSVQLAGTALDRDASGRLDVGARDSDGNWPMLLHVKNLDTLPEGGYYDLYLTRDGKPRVLCGTFNVTQGEAVIRLSAAYDLSRFDRNGWVVTRQPPGHHEPTEIVLRPSV
jgi:anti-sigma-K factor RskA